jgi:hypothetical protein
MAVFTGGTVDRTMSKNLKRKDDAMDDQHHTPLMAAKRARGKKSWYRQSQTWVAIGILVLFVGGVSLLFESHGGDREAGGTKHYQPWGHDAPVRIEHTYGELARARARLERAVEAPVSDPNGAAKNSAKGKLAAKKDGKVNSFNKWLDKNHKPQHTLAAALKQYEKKHGYKRGHHTMKGGEYKAPDHNWGKKFGKFLAKTHPVGHTLHDAGVHPDTYHAATTSPSKVCVCVSTCLCLHGTCLVCAAHVYTHRGRVCGMRVCVCMRVCERV